jgi:hypothetical protein
MPGQNVHGYTMHREEQDTGLHRACYSAWRAEQAVFLPVLYLMLRSLPVGAYAVMRSCYPRGNKVRPGQAPALLQYEFFRIVIVVSAGIKPLGNHP